MLLAGADAVGKPVLHVIRNAELNELLEGAARADETSDSVEAELELGGLKPRRVLARAIKLREAPGGVLAVFVDVTELRRLESVRRDFVANASHELRSPLTSIRAAVETLHAVKDEPAEAGRFIEVIERNSERIENLVADLLELARLESRELDLHPEPIALSSAVERVFARQSARAELKHITLANETASDPVSVRADARALDHLLGNLVDNALKYCPSGATVRVTAQPADGQVRVGVADDGPGIPPEHLPRLFERFYRVDAGRSRELGGTGLGLSIVKHLAEAMGGAVTVDSRVGAGTTFSFTLPRA
jgi:two-component system phosphate regulon sensor histidine kinase PhoR